MKDHKTDWFAFWLHFLCGAILGALLGLYFWGRWGLYNSPTAGALCIGGGALIVGLLAASRQHDFWDWR